MGMKTAVTWNVNKAGGNSKNDILETIGRNGAQLALLQEVDNFVNNECAQGLLVRQESGG